MKTSLEYHQFDQDYRLIESLHVKLGLLVPLMLKVEPFGFWSLNAMTGDVWWSEEIYRIHGLKPSQGTVKLGKAIALYHPADALLVEALVNEAITQKKGFGFTLRLRRPDGKERFVQALASIELDANQNTKMIYGIFRDVTQSASRKATLKNRGKLVTSLIDNSPSPIAILDQKLCYVQMNSAWLEYHGLKNLETYIGKSHYEAMPEIPQKWRKEHQRALRGETIHRKQSIQQGEKHRTTSKFSSCMFPWYTALGEIGGIIIMVTPTGNREIAQSKEAERVERLMQQADDTVPRLGEIRR
jgi:PAS domain-containing protein